MTLMEALEKQLDKEIEGKATPPEPEEKVNTQELYSQLLEKKMKEMETMFNNKMNTLIEEMQKKNAIPAEKTAEEGVNDDSTTDVPNAE